MSKKPTLYILKGLPASGKSTIARDLIEKNLKHNIVRVNKDLLRSNLHFDNFSHKKEEATQKASMLLVENFLLSGYDVINDDTNLNPKVLQSYVDLAEKCNAEVKIIDLLEEASVADLLRRNELRGSNKSIYSQYVDPSVIYKMAFQYSPFMKGQKTIIVDIDGTIADCEHRRHHITNGKKNWSKFFEEVSKDPPRDEIISQIIKDRDENDALIIFVSGRPESTRESTEFWLSNNFINQYSNSAYGDKFYPYLINFPILFMRGTSDNRSDVIVKSEIYDKYLSKLDIVRVYDDRPSVIRMWRSKGLEVVDVGDGVEF